MFAIVILWFLSCLIVLRLGGCFDGWISWFDGLFLEALVWCLIFFLGLSLIVLLV